jgi:hypothetical protein
MHLQPIALDVGPPLQHSVLLFPQTRLALRPWFLYLFTEAGNTTDMGILHDIQATFA